MNKFSCQFLIAIAMSGLATAANALVCSELNQLTPFTINPENSVQILNSAACNKEILNVNGALKIGLLESNNESVTFNNFGQVLNNGTIINSNSIFNNNTGAVFSNNSTYNAIYGNLNNYSGATVNNSGTIYSGLGNFTNSYISNNGNFNNSGIIFNNTGSIYNNLGGVITNTGILNSLAYSGFGITNSGIIINEVSGIIDNKALDAWNNPSPIINSGRIVNNGEISVRYGAGINNSGTLINNGLIKSTSTGCCDGGQSTIQSSGILTNNGIIISANLHASTLDGKGVIIFRENEIQPEYTYPGYAIVSKMIQSALDVSNGLYTIGTLQVENVVMSTNSNFRLGAETSVLNVGTITADTVNLSGLSTLNVSNGNIGTLTGGVTNISESIRVDNLLGGIIGFHISGTAPDAFSVLSVTNSELLTANSLSFNFSFSDYVPNVGDTWSFLIADKGFGPNQSFDRAFTQVIDNSTNMFKISAISSGLQLELMSTILPAPVPEPETYSMFLMGLSLMGIFATRRKSYKA